MSAGQQFPILGQSPRTYVPWDFVAEHGQQAERNHHQTVKRLAERGGLSWGELYAVVTDSHWRDLDKTTGDTGYRAEVLKLLDQWLARFDR